MHRKNGFTLIELLIVMVVIGILATIAVRLFWDSKDRALLRTMQSDLRSLATQQELYYPAPMTYAGAVGDLPEFSTSPGVVVNITFANSLGWAAQATHPSYAGHTCGIFVGNAPAANGAPASEPGVIACD